DVGAHASNRHETDDIAENGPAPPQDVDGNARIRHPQAPLPRATLATKTRDDTAESKVAATTPSAPTTVTQPAPHGPPSSSTSTTAAYDPPPCYTAYFEPQSAAYCGLHAINNGLGFQYRTPDMASDAVPDFLAHWAHEGVDAAADDHIAPSGDYSIELLSFSLQCSGNVFTIETTNPMRASVNDVGSLSQEGIRNTVGIG
ncbi:unnamed protein product, partial [Prorocentrum cordatum]